LSWLSDSFAALRWGIWLRCYQLIDGEALFLESQQDKKAVQKPRLAVVFAFLASFFGLKISID